MTPAQREHLYFVADMTDYRETEEAIRAVLADLDACRKALVPVAREIVNWRDGGDTRVGVADWVHLLTVEADAILAAAGEEQA